MATMKGESMPALCRDCHEEWPQGMADERCPECGSPRLLRHLELNSLSLAHIDCDAYFSKEDRMAATPFGQPAFPEVTYLVVSVVEGELKGKKAFRWDEEEEIFAEVDLQLIPGPFRNKA